MEEESIVRPGVLDEPLHAANLRNRKVSSLLSLEQQLNTHDVRARRQAHLCRVGRVEQHDDVLLLVVVPLAEELGHVARVVVAAVQLAPRACKHRMVNERSRNHGKAMKAHRCLRERERLSERISRRQISTHS